MQIYQFSCILWIFSINLHRKPSNKDFPGGYQSGQMGQTVNLLAYAFGGSNPSPPTKKGCLHRGILFLYLLGGIISVFQKHLLFSALPHGYCRRKLHS